MKKTIFVLAIFSLFWGCNGPGNQGDPAEARVEGGKGLPVRVGAQRDKGLPVEVHMKDGEKIPIDLQVRSDEAIPVKLEVKGEESIPVKLEIEGDKAVPVKLDIREGQSFPVEIKLSQRALVFISIAGGAIFLIAVVSCFVAVAAARSAKAVSQSVDVIKKAQQRREAGLSSSKNG